MTSWEYHEVQIFISLTIPLFSKFIIHKVEVFLTPEYISDVLKLNVNSKTNEISFWH